MEAQVTVMNHDIDLMIGSFIIAITVCGLLLNEGINPGHYFKPISNISILPLQPFTGHFSTPLSF